MAPRTHASSRLLFLDLARCLAIVLMVFAHVTDALLLPAEWQTDLGRLYLHARGYTAPIFFLVSGWAFAAVTMRRFAEHQKPGPAVARRLRRVALLFAWGAALTLPWWAEGFPFDVPRAHWEPFLSFGVLHCIGAALLGAQVLVRLSPSPRAYGWLALVAGVMAIALGPTVQHWAAVLPWWARGPLNTGSFGGGFPLLPWAAYFWLGSALGTAVWRQQLSAKALAARLVALGAGLLVAGAAIRSACLDWLGWERWPASPSLCLHRLGVTLLLLGVLALAAPRLSSLARPIQAPARRALTFYVGHMLIIWGVPFIDGLFHRVGMTLEFPETALVAVLSIGTLWLGVGLQVAVRAAWRTGTAARAQTEETRTAEA